MQEPMLAQTLILRTSQLLELGCVIVNRERGNIGQSLGSNEGNNVECLDTMERGDPLTGGRPFCSWFLPQFQLLTQN